MIDILFSIFSAIYNGIVTLISVITSLPSWIDKIRLIFLRIFPVSEGYGLIVGSALIAMMFISIIIGIKRLIL